jgi:hypothetical protein
MESGQEDVSQVEQNKCRNGNRNTEDECYTKKQKGPPPSYQHPWLVATNNFFASLSDAEMGSEGNSTKTHGTNESMAKVGHLPSY